MSLNIVLKILSRIYLSCVQAAECGGAHHLPARLLRAPHHQEVVGAGHQSEAWIWSRDQDTDQSEAVTRSRDQPLTNESAGYAAAVAGQLGDAPGGAGAGAGRGQLPRGRAAARRRHQARAAGIHSLHQRSSTILFLLHYSFFYTIHSSTLHHSFCFHVLLLF